MRIFAVAMLCLITTPLAAEQFTGVLVNPRTGYVSAIIVVDRATLRPEHLSACGTGCEFTDFMLPGQCMVVSVSRREASYGYHFGPFDDLANSRSQARRFCERYGGTECREYQPICG